MNPFINCQCRSILENAMASPLGAAAMCYFESFKKNFDQIFPIEEIKKKLQNNEYNSITDFVDNVKEIFLNSARQINADSEISLALQTICHTICEKSRQLNGIDKNQYQTNMKEISQILTNILPSIPDSAEEFQNLLSVQDLLPIEEYVPLLPNLGSDGTTVDPNELYDKLLRLPSDDDVSRIVDIIVNYESAYSHENSVMKIELARCHQYTLRLIKNYLNNVELLDESTIQKTD